MHSTPLIDHPVLRAAAMVLVLCQTILMNIPQGDTPQSLRTAAGHQLGLERSPAPGEHRVRVALAPTAPPLSKNQSLNAD